MGKKKRKTKEGRKDIFDKVKTVFKNPINTDIVQELSRGPQRAIDLADNIDVPKQSINYHLNELLSSRQDAIFHFLHFYSFLSM